jgi:hypothetical protein
MHYGGQPLDNAQGKTMVEVGPLANLPALIDSLIEAVRVGVLDWALANAAAERGRLLNRNGRLKAT